MMTQNNSRADFLALRTTPIILKNGDRSLNVNALLDEASTKTCVNADILNGQIETFDTKPVNFELLSVDCKVKMHITAYTAKRVMGDMTVIDWNEYRSQWPYLRKMNFPLPAKKQIVDVLIGLYCLDLHGAIEEVRDRPREPVAGLTPLGWACTSNPYSAERTRLQIHFACTYFVREQSEIEELNTNLKRFWEIEETPPLNPTSVCANSGTASHEKGRTLFPV